MHESKIYDSSKYQQILDQTDQIVNIHFKGNMELLWNERSIGGPPIYTKPQNHSGFNLESLRQLLQKMLSTYTTGTFDETAALASRLIARRMSSFRSQIGFKQLRKTSIALSRLKDINIISVLENFLGTLPDYLIEGKVSLPTKDNFQFVMLRLQSLSKLLLRIAICARESSIAFRDMIQRNFFIEISVLYIGLLAQIWDLAKHLSIKTRDFYNALYLYGRCFESKSKKEVGNMLGGLMFTEKLENWLGDAWTNEFFGHSLKETPKRTSTKRALGIDFGDFDDEGHDILGMQVDMQKPTQINMKKIIRQDFHKVEPKKERVESDIGVAISRDSLEEVVNVDKIVKVDEISKLVNEEQLMRNNECAKRTAHLSENQWKEFRMKIRNILVTSEGRVCIKKFKNLWKSVAK